jgi:hypothetical protein
MMSEAKSEEKREKVIMAKDATYIIKRDCSVTNNSDCFMVVCLGAGYDDAKHNCVRVRRLDDAEYLVKALRLVNADKRCGSVNEVLMALKTPQDVANQVMRLLCR